MKIELTAFWGDGCGSSTIKISIKQWESIKQGREFTKNTWGFADGKRFSVYWTFENGFYSIDGDDGMQCIFDESVDQLIMD